MKILLLIDQTGNELQLFRTATNELTLQISCDVSNNEISYTLDEDDRKSLINELARLRDIKK